jgi:hypothetical protein
MHFVAQIFQFFTKLGMHVSDNKPLHISPPLTPISYKLQHKSQISWLLLAGYTVLIPLGIHSILIQICSLSPIPSSSPAPAVTYRGGFEGFNRPHVFLSYDTAEPNSQFRGKYIRNNLIRIRGSLIWKLNETPDYGGYCPPRSPFCPSYVLNWICWTTPKKILGVIPLKKFLVTPLPSRGPLANSYATALQGTTFQ